MLIGRLIKGSVLCWAAVCGLSPFAASAGGFSIAPVRLNVPAGTRSAALTVRNQEETPMVIQVRAFDWSQQNGQDVLEETRELIATPAVVTVPPGESQLVRVALRRPADPQRELTYRLFVEEVPRQPDPNTSGLNVTVRMSLPVFVEGAQSRTTDVRWTASLDESDHLVLTAENAGNTHVQFAELAPRHPTLDLDLGTDRAGGYVLAGQTRSFRLSLAGAALDQLNELALHGYSDAGDVDVVVPLIRP